MGLIVYVVGVIFVLVVSDEDVLRALYDHQVTWPGLIFLFQLFPPFNFARALSDIEATIAGPSAPDACKTMSIVGIVQPINHPLF